jgi:hypothetical protein
MKKILLIVVLLICCGHCFAQHLGMTFQKAEQQGIIISNLDSDYKSAVHVDTAQAVFKTESEQQAMHKAYVELLKNFGKFLTANDFRWEKPTRCFNRIYFSASGSIDYFLYNFLGQPEEKPAEEKQKEFDRLLNIFIRDYKLSLSAKEKFAQCSPATYRPME